MKQADIACKLKKSPSFVSKWCRATEFFDSPRSGRPVTALTPENLKKLNECEGKLGQSNRVMGAKLGFSKSSASRGFQKLNLFAYRRGVQSRMKPKHIKQRYRVSNIMRLKPIAFWERFLITDEKIWTVDGYFNPQNDRVRARCKEDVQAVERDKFPGKRMVWLGHSALGTTPLVHFKGNVNGKVYLNKVLKKVVAEDILVQHFPCDMDIVALLRNGKSQRDYPFTNGNYSNGIKI